MLKHMKQKSLPERGSGKNRIIDESRKELPILS
jgi:hypothetical protein